MVFQNLNILLLIILIIIPIVEDKYLYQFSEKNKRLENTDYIIQIFILHPADLPFKHSNLKSAENAKYLEKNNKLYFKNILVLPV